MPISRAPHVVSSFARPRLGRVRGSVAVGRGSPSVAYGSGPSDVRRSSRWTGGRLRRRTPMSAWRCRLGRRVRDGRGSGARAADFVDVGRCRRGGAGSAGASRRLRLPPRAADCRRRAADAGVAVAGSAAPPSRQTGRGPPIAAASAARVRHRRHRRAAPPRSSARRDPAARVERPGRSRAAAVGRRLPSRSPAENADAGAPPASPSGSAPISPITSAGGRSRATRSPAPASAVTAASWPIGQRLDRRRGPASRPS